jgi:P-type Na+/K+ transporter
MITGGPPAFGLGVEEASPDVMNRPPQDATVGVFSWAVIADTFAVRFYPLSFGNYI